MLLILFGKPISVWGGGGTQNPAKKDCTKKQYTGKQVTALFGPFYSLFGPFLTLFNTQTPFKPCWVIFVDFLLRGGQGLSLRILWQCFERQKRAF